MQWTGKTNVRVCGRVDEYSGTDQSKVSDALNEISRAWDECFVYCGYRSTITVRVRVYP